MDRYIGIDVHSESCTFAVMGPTGRRLREAVVETDAKALTDFVRSVAGQKHICLEEGTLSEWLYELLEPLAHELVVMIAPPTEGNKNDSSDAWRRANDLRLGQVKRPVYKAPERLTALRAATKAYLVTQRDQVRTKTRLSNLYRSRGLHQTGSDIYSPDKRAPWLEQLPVAQRHQAEVLSLQLDGLVATHELAHRWLLDEARTVPAVRLLETAPGIGEIRAAQIVATVVSPHRFRTRRQFWAYCGLAIVMRSSSDWAKDHHGNWERRMVAQSRGLNQNRHPVLKNVFRGAAQTVVRHLPDHPLSLAYQRALAAGTKPNLAQLTLARRLAGAVLAMWKHKEEYDQSKQQA